MHKNNIISRFANPCLKRMASFLFLVWFKSMLKMFLQTSREIWFFIDMKYKRIILLSSIINEKRSIREESNRHNKCLQNMVHQQGYRLITLTWIFTLLQSMHWEKISFLSTLNGKYDKVITSYLSIWAICVPWIHR